MSLIFRLKKNTLAGILTQKSNLVGGRIVQALTLYRGEIRDRLANNQLL